MADSAKTKLVNDKLQQLQSEQKQQNKQEELARWAQNFTTAITLDLTGEKNSSITQQTTQLPQPPQPQQPQPLQPPQPRQVQKPELEDMVDYERAMEEKDLTDKITRLVRRRAIVRQLRIPNFMQGIDDSLSTTSTPWSDPVL